MEINARGFGDKLRSSFFYCIENPIAKLIATPLRVITRGDPWAANWSTRGGNRHARPLNPCKVQLLGSWRCAVYATRERATFRIVSTRRFVLEGQLGTAKVCGQGETVCTLGWHRDLVTCLIGATLTTRAGRDKPWAIHHRLEIMVLPFWAYNRPGDLPRAFTPGGYTHEMSPLPR